MGHAPLTEIRKYKTFEWSEQEQSSFEQVNDAKRK